MINSCGEGARDSRGQIGQDLVPVERTAHADLPDDAAQSQIRPSRTLMATRTESRMQHSSLFENPATSRSSIPSNPPPAGRVFSPLRMRHFFNRPPHPKTSTCRSTFPALFRRSTPQNSGRSGLQPCLRLSAGALFFNSLARLLDPCPMPSSSRSMALRASSCGLQFMACNRRQM